MDTLKIKTVIYKKNKKFDDQKKKKNSNFFFTRTAIRGYFHSSALSYNGLYP